MYIACQLALECIATPRVSTSAPWHRPRPPQHSYTLGYTKGIHVAPGKRCSHRMRHGTSLWTLLAKLQWGDLLGRELSDFDLLRLTSMRRIRWPPSPLRRTDSSVATQPHWRDAAWAALRCGCARSSDVKRCARMRAISTRSARCCCVAAPPPTAPFGSYSRRRPPATGACAGTSQRAPPVCGLRQRPMPRCMHAPLSRSGVHACMAPAAHASTPPIVLTNATSMQ